MKKWTEAKLVILNISKTANGRNDNKYEEVYGGDPNNEYTDEWNKNGTGMFIPTASITGEETNDRS